MRGPVRTLGFDARFDEAVGQEQSNPGAAAFTFADIADRLSAAGYGGHADALRRRALQAYNAAGRCSDAAWLHTRIVAEAVNGQVAVPGGGQLKVPTPRVDQVLFRVVPPLARAWRMR
jgi:hypothetical protein